MTAALWVAAAYLCGSVPVGFLLARAAGIDVRRHGSGNIGATNVARLAGRGLGILTLIGDAAKGFLPVAAAAGTPPETRAAVALAAVVGHTHSIFLRGRGGKGVATSFGVLLALAPFVLPPLLIVFFAVVLASRYVSAASLAAAALAPAATAVLGYPWPMVAAAAGLALLIWWRHKENIERLRKGTEPRFSPRSP